MDVVMTFDKLVWAITAFWDIGAVAIFVRWLLETIAVGVWTWFVFIPLAAIVLFWLVAFVSFNFYAQATADFITKLFAHRTVDRWRFWV